MRFEVRVLAADDRVSTVFVEAMDATVARHAVAQQSLRALSVRPARGSVLARRRARFSLGLFSQELLALLEAGLSLVEALESLQERSGAETRDVVDALAYSIRQGQRFSHALAAQPAYFPPLYVGIIQAAENTSDLPGALARYVEFDQRASQLRAKAVSAAIYPLILLSVGTAVTLFLVGYVVPRFAVVYEESGRQMSALTGALLGWGRLVAEHGLAILAAVIAVFVLAAIIVWRSRGRVAAIDLLARLPLVARHAHQYELARLYMTLGLLLTGGIPLVKALRIVEPTVGAQTRDRLRRVAPRIAAGEAFAAALQSEQLADSVALRLLRVGERAGTLADMLIRAARFHDAEVSRFVDRFTRVAEPLLMAAIGLVVGTIVILLYMPIFELAGSLQ
ncbi:MAG: type II secretion system F family protein [Xanthomonadaceae bacterium]|jgi:general secretion pathway protein F|nr:type II secretion system F family protein [Xanthomonadaceae bacterium]